MVHSLSEVNNSALMEPLIASFFVLRAEYNLERTDPDFGIKTSKKGSPKSTDPPPLRLAPPQTARSEKDDLLSSAVE